MDMKYRDRNETIAQILESTNGDRVRLTKIMYDVYLSHGLTKEYVRLLIGSDGISRWRKNVQDYRKRHEFSAYPS
jgi:predicted transcriptional regulator